MRICDPTCGSGGMLIECAHYVRNHGGNPKNLTYHGQEKNLGTWAIAKMNLLLHGLTDARIEKGDTIRDPKLVKDGGLILYDRVVANPPFSLDEWGSEVAEHDGFGRFRHGIPPKAKGDLAFVQHMLATLNAHGRLAVVMPNGVLSRRGSEAEIRGGLLSEDLVECVIGLPVDLFYGAGIPTSVLVLNRAKPAERRGRVLFVDATRRFVSGKGQNYLRDEDIAAISSAFRAFHDEPAVSRVVPITAIQSPVFDLTVGSQVTRVEVRRTASVADSASLFNAAQEELARATARMLDAIAGQSSSASWRSARLRDVLVENNERAGAAGVSLPVLSVTKSRGLMLASERFGKPLHGRDLTRYRVARRGQLVVDPMLLWDGALGLQRRVDAGLVSPDYRVFDVAAGVSADFIDYLLRSPLMRPHFQSGARGTNVRRNRIGRSVFDALPIQLPPLEDQQRIASTMQAVDVTLDRATALARSVEVLRESVLASLLNGPDEPETQRHGHATPANDAGAAA